MDFLDIQYFSFKINLIPVDHRMSIANENHYYVTGRRIKKSPLFYVEIISTNYQIFFFRGFDKIYVTERKNVKEMGGGKISYVLHIRELISFYIRLNLNSRGCQGAITVQFNQIS